MLQHNSSDTKTTALAVAEGEQKAQLEKEHLSRSDLKEKNKCYCCTAIFPDIRLPQTCQITWIHPVLTKNLFRFVVLQGLLILETHRESQDLISTPFRHVPQMDMTAVCIWQIKSDNWTCCECTQPVLEPEPWGCIEKQVYQVSQKGAFY